MGCSRRPSGSGQILLSLPAPRDATKVSVTPDVSWGEQGWVWPPVVTVSRSFTVGYF